MSCLAPGITAKLYQVLWSWSFKVFAGHCWKWLLMLIFHDIPTPGMLWILSRYGTKLLTVQEKCLLSLPSSQAQRGLRASGLGAKALFRTPFSAFQDGFHGTEGRQQFNYRLCKSPPKRLQVRKPTTQKSN